MYIPAWFQEERLDVLHELMRQYAFAALVTSPPERPFATHLPFLLDAGRGAFGTLRAHIARANPQWQHFEAGQEVLVLFQGAHTYVSPTWYATQPSVPTWNYAVVHAYGIPRLLTDDELYDTLLASLAVYEAQPENLPLTPDYLQKMMRGIVGFEIELTRMEGKFKLSQNRSETDRLNVIEALQKSDDPLACDTAVLMQSTFPQET